MLMSLTTNSFYWLVHIPSYVYFVRLFWTRCKFWDIVRLIILKLRRSERRSPERPVFGDAGEDIHIG